MTLKELTKREFLEAIARMEREPTVQNWLAMDRLADAYIRECEEEVEIREQARKEQAR